MKIKKIYGLFLLLLLVSCYDDKGNYSYEPKTEITITGIPETMSLLGSSDHIICNPKINSSREGEIKEDNSNFEFKYQIDLNSGRLDYYNPWPVINPRGNLNLDTLAGYAANTYTLWFTVTDKRTGVATSAISKVKITSPVYEGYMVWCNEGPENRARMDMVSVISADRIIPAYNILQPLGLPDLKNAVSIGWAPQLWSGGDLLYVMSNDGAYKLNEATFETGEDENMKIRDFMISTMEDNPIRYYMVGNYYGISAGYLMCVTNKGNAYTQDPNIANGAFEYPVNTPVTGQDPVYRVSPYVGVSYAADEVSSSSALLYDIDNKRFVGWNIKNPSICVPLTNPAEGKLFDFQTGMDLVYMIGTRFSNGLVYAVLQDNSGNRHIYGINLAADAMKQEVAYSDITATDFNKAQYFAFHSQFPFMYYAVDNKVYSYNLATKTVNLAITLPERQKVTMLKFNLFMNPGMGWSPSEDFLAKQYELMVASYDEQATDVNGGTLAFYKVQNTTNTLTKITDYSGFAKIVDVVYRERR